MLALQGACLRCRLQLPERGSSAEAAALAGRLAARQQARCTEDRSAVWELLHHTPASASHSSILLQLLALPYTTARVPNEHR